MTHSCLKCPEDIRGKCCYVNIIIGGFNILLDNVPCPLLDLQSKRCMDYTHRLERAPWCLKGKNQWNTGGLPKGCLFLKNHPERELTPKLDVEEVLEQLPFEKQGKIVENYNLLNNFSFQELQPYLKRGISK